MPEVTTDAPLECPDLRAYIEWKSAVVWGEIACEFAAEGREEATRHAEDRCLYYLFLYWQAITELEDLQRN